jgi:hypothetical protein
MVWMITSAVLGGLVVGFMAGASRSSTGGNVAAAVAALQLGVFALLGRDASQGEVNLELVGMLFVVFLVCLVAAYVCANRLRKIGKLEWMGSRAGEYRSLLL